MMNDDKNKPLNPDDYWPEMEQMLDRHFVVRKRRRVLWIALLLLIGSSALVMQMRKNDTAISHEVNTSSSMSNSVASSNASAAATKNTNTPTQENNNTVISTSSTSSSSTDSEKRTQEKQPAIVESKEINKIETNSNNATVVIHHSAINKSSVKDEIDVKDNSSPLSLSIKKSKTSKHIDSSILFNSAITDNSVNASDNNLEGLTPATAKTIPFLSALSANYSITTRPSDTLAGVKTFIPEKKKKRFDLQVYAGTSYIHDELKGNSTINYTERRNREESPVILPHAGASVSTGQGHWDFRAGIELSMLGQKIKYSPFSDGDYYTTRGDWQQYQYTISDSDSTYILGIIFISTHTVVINDSTLITVTDTVRGAHYDASIAEANGVNKSYYIEIPLEAAYTVFKNKWGFGISAGISPAYLISTKGYYLTSDQSKIEKLNKETSTQLFLSGRINLELSYLLSDRLRLMIRPTARKNLTEIRDGSSTLNRYTSVGVNVGAVWKIR